MATKPGVMDLRPNDKEREAADAHVGTLVKSITGK